MAYYCRPYVGMPPKQTRKAATFKVHKWHAQNVCVTLVKAISVIIDCFYELLTRLLTILENIAKVPHRQVTIIYLTNLLSFDFLLALVKTSDSLVNSALNVYHWLFYPWSGYLGCSQAEEIEVMGGLLWCYRLVAQGIQKGSCPIVFKQNSVATNICEGITLLYMSMKVSYWNFDMHLQKNPSKMFWGFVSVLWL